ncbi:RHS repeat-associated core domain-containing protein, partial [Streptomyces sp. NPDC048845]|uniref:RHS repeat-associated core domain-containing protein n=1 Tax=Streptomyces sp. NPDC048845 TaxID=3155390 RepID=UPI003442711F
LNLPDDTTWLRDYDDRGNCTAVTDPTGATTRYTYDARGSLTSVTDALDATTRIRCNTAGLPCEITDPVGSRLTREHDAFGRVTTVTDPLGAETRLWWTVEGHITRARQPDGAEQTWTYDGEGNCTAHTDPVGGTTQYEYTHFDLLTARTTPDGARYEFAHDASLRLTQVTNPQGLTWIYGYDPAGRLAFETDFDGRNLTYTHDPADRLTTRTNTLGETIHYEHDVLGRVTTKNAAGQVTHYTYDPHSRLTSAASPSATLTLDRDPLGRITSETVNGRSITYRYDALGRRTGRTTPTGSTSTWAHDATGRAVSLNTSGRELAFTHDAAGREVARHIGEALALAHTFDSTGRLTTQSVTTQTSTTDNETLRRRAYTYRLDGNLATVTDEHSGTRTFDLDAMGRVTAVNASGWTERYAYDEAGNQTQADWPSLHTAAESTGPRAYTGTVVTRAGTTRYEHDAQGRVTLRQKTRLSRKPDTWHYHWDAEDRLTHVVTPDGTRWRYRYDPLGRRIAKQRLTNTGDIAEQVDFTWDGTTLAEQTTTTPDHPNQITLTWDYNGLQPLAQTERLTNTTDQQEIDRRFFAIVTDLVGTPTELVDETGNITWHSRTTLWGTTTWARTSTAHTPLRFPGQYHDPETGLHYNYFRYYDAEIARYVSQDPLGLIAAPNPVTYVPNPTGWTDALGLSPYSDSISIYRTPKAADARYELDNGPNPANHQPGVDIGGGIMSDGKVYFGESGVAAEYAGPTGLNFAKGMVRYDMDPSFLAEFGEFAKVYDRQGPGGSVRLEFPIPVDKLDRFNELTRNRSWVSIYGGP